MDVHTEIIKERDHIGDPGIDFVLNQAPCIKVHEEVDAWLHPFGSSVLGNSER